MPNSDEQVSKFVQAITKYAEEQRDQLLKEVEDFKIQQLQQAEQKVLLDAYQLIQKERIALQNETRLEMSRRELEARKKLLEKRRDMMEALFEEAGRQIADWTQTPAYGEALEASLRRMMQQLPENGTVYALSPRDEDKLAALSALCPPGSRLETAEDIHLGGLRGVNAEAGLRLDDTLDTRLELQREWFVQNSGLTIE